MVPEVAGFGPCLFEGFTSPKGSLSLHNLDLDVYSMRESLISTETTMNNCQTNAFTFPSSNPRIPHYYYSSPPLVAMQNQREHRSLWFIVYGDKSSASQVHIQTDLNIDGLKKAINEERFRLNCPTISNMLLWKPTTPISVSNFETDALDRSFVRFPDPNSDEVFNGKCAVQRLRIGDTVFRHWRECPDERQLHIIAQERCMFLFNI